MPGPRLIAGVARPGRERPRLARRRRPVLVVAATAATALLSACVPTGERPALGDPVTTAPPDDVPTGVAEADGVLAMLDAVDQHVFTAEYDVLRKLGPVEGVATVAQVPPRRAVRIGSTVFVTGEDAEDRTCSLETGLCEAGLVEQRVSDLAIGSGFYGPGPARQLRVAVGRRAGEVRGETREIGGVEASCVIVPLGGGEETYCAAPQGPLALLDTAAHTIELRSLSGESDPSSLLPVEPSPASDG